MTVASELQIEFLDDIGNRIVGGPRVVWGSAGCA